MQKLLARTIKMPRFLNGALLVLPMLMFAFIAFMLVRFNSPTITRIIYPLPKNRSVIFNTLGHNYQLRTSKSTSHKGFISYLKWADTRLGGNGNVILSIYQHDIKTENKPIPLTAFNGTASGSKFYWSKDGSLFAAFIGTIPIVAYDFRDHKTITLSSGELSAIPTIETKKIQALLSNRGGKVGASFSQARWISIEEFQNFPKRL